MPEASGEGSGRDAKKLVFTFEVSVLDRGGDGWEARCDDGDLHLTGVESQRLLVEKVKEHFLRIGDAMGPVGDRVLFHLLLDCPDPDAAAPGESRPDERPEAEGRKSQGATLRAEFHGLGDDVEDLASRVDDLEDEVEDLRSRIADLEGELR